MNFDIYIGEQLKEEYSTIYSSYEVMHGLYTGQNESDLQGASHKISGAIFVDFDIYIKKYAKTDSILKHLNSKVNFSVISNFIVWESSLCGECYFYLGTQNIDHLLTLLYDIVDLENINITIHIVNNIDTFFSPKLLKFISKNNIEINRG